MSEIHRVDVRDESLLDIVSGLESAARRFDDLVAEYVPGRPAAGIPDDPRTLDLVLGLVAVRERLRAVLAASTAKSTARAATGRDPGVEESWLR